MFIIKDLPSAHDPEILRRAHQEVWADERPKSVDPEKVLQRFYDFWALWVDRDHEGKYVNAPLPKDVEKTVRRWVQMGLTFDDIQEFTTATMLRSQVRWEDKFAYFAGCCWRRARRVFSHAQRMVAAELTAGLPMPPEGPVTSEDAFKAVG